MSWILLLSVVTAVAFVLETPKLRYLQVVIVGGALGLLIGIALNVSTMTKQIAPALSRCIGP